LVNRNFLPKFALPFKKSIEKMARVCDLTGKKAITGNKVSFSNKKTKRLFKPNLQVKKFYLPEADEWVTLKVSTSAIRNINKKGLMACLKDARDNGLIIF
jgi:large subunit ribosomal protein L28